MHKYAKYFGKLWQMHLKLFMHITQIKNLKISQKYKASVIFRLLS